MQRLAAWLKTWKDEITAAAAILGVIIGIVGFALTLHQLSRTTETLQASNGYEIQRDDRALIDKLLANPQFRDALSDNTVFAKNKAFMLDNLWSMFHFYLSVYRQAEVRGVVPEFISSFKTDFCEFMHNPVVAESWKELSAAGRINSTQELMRQRWCDV